MQAMQRHNGVCDKDGCDFNPYRLGDKSFFGLAANFTIDTTKTFTVVTQFITVEEQIMEISQKSGACGCRMGKL
jgi:hypothetical protein